MTQPKKIRRTTSWLKEWRNMQAYGFKKTTLETNLSADDIGRLIDEYRQGRRNLRRH